MILKRKEKDKNQNHCEEKKNVHFVVMFIFQPKGKEKLKRAKG